MASFMIFYMIFYYGYKYLFATWGTQVKPYPNVVMGEYTSAPFSRFSIYTLFRQGIARGP